MDLLQGGYLRASDPFLCLLVGGMKGCRQTFARVLPPSPPFLSGFLLPVGGRGDDKQGLAGSSCSSSWD